VRIRTLLLGITLLLGVLAYSHGQEGHSGLKSGSGRTFQYTSKKLGIPILRASITIENGPLEQGRHLYQVQAHVDSLNLGFLFRVNNRFTSIMDAETFSPVRYVKEIDQEGLLTERKKYSQTLTFDWSNGKVVVETNGVKERKEVFLPSDTYDPLSMFARCYLKNELQPGHDVYMNIYDGVKLGQIIFHSKKERVKSNLYGDIEAYCLESLTTFSTYGDKRGTIRIWYTADSEKTPISMELSLPVGNVRFELEGVRQS